MHQIDQVNTKTSFYNFSEFCQTKLRFQGKTLQDLQQERKGAIF